MLKFWTRLLLAAWLVLHFASAQSASVLERLQWQDSRHTGTPPPTGDSTWQAAGKEVGFGLNAGTLWLRLRVTTQEREDLYLALRLVGVDDLAVGVQDASVPEGSPALQSPPAAMTGLNAQDMHAGKRLLRGFDMPTGEAIVWIRARGQGVGWLQADVVSANELAQQRAADSAISAMQLTFCALLVLANMALYLQSRKKVFRSVALLGLLSGLYQLQLSGLFIGLLGEDLGTFVRINASMTLLMACASLYASAALLASPRLQRTYTRGFYALLGGSLLMTVFAFSTKHSGFNLLAAGLLLVALCGFCMDCARQWLQASAGRKGLFHPLLAAAFLLFVGIQLSILGPMFSPALHRPWLDPLQALNLPVIFLALMSTLLWRQQREQSLKDRRRQSNFQKLQEQRSINRLQQLFMSMLVHEIKTPLTVVQLGSSALAKTDITPERKQTWALRMQAAIDGIVQILDKCSQAGRYEAGVMTVSLSDFLLADSLALAMRQALVHTPEQAALLQLHCETPIDNLHLRSDASYFQIILNNLINNALTYSAPGSTVILRVSQFASGQGAPMVQFAVSNVKGAAGHPDPAKVFERYYRSPAASGIAGTGLGLWLSQQLAQRLGTKIELTLEAERVVFWFAMAVDGKGANSA